MFDIIVFCSFTLFGWVAIIGAIYKNKLRKYRKLKKTFLSKKDKNS